MSELPVVSRLTDFDRTTMVSPVAGRVGEFSVELDAGWSAFAGVHGGYLCAVAVRGAEAHEPGRPVRTVATSFLRPGRVGEAGLIVRELRRGRSFTTVTVDLVQDGRLVLTSQVTMVEQRPGAEWGEVVPPDLPLPEECVAFTPPASVVNFARVESAFDPARLPFDPERALVRGYIRPLEARRVDAAWLAMACDWFPPPAFSRVEAPVGGVSVDFTVHVHRTRPPLGEGWLAGVFEVPNSSGGLAVEHGRITEADGTLLAESFQTRLTVGL